MSYEEKEYTEDSNEGINSSRFHLYPGDIWKGFLKFWWLCVVLAIVIGGVMFYRSYSSYVPYYTTSATFTVNKNQSLSGFQTYSYYYDSSTAILLSKTFPFIIESNLLSDAICEDLEISSYSVSLSIETVEDTNMLTLVARGYNAQSVYDVICSALKNCPSVARYIIGDVKLTIISSPELPTSPANRYSFRDATIKGALVGLALGVCVILLYALLRGTIRTRDDITKEFQTETIGTIPQVSFKKYTKQIDQTIIQNNKMVGEGFVESLRIFRNTFVHALSKDDKVVLFTSTAPGEGKTTVITNLALSVADLGKKVLLVDGDLKNPSVNELIGFNTENTQTTVKAKEELYNIHYIDSLKIDIMNFSLDSHSYWEIMSGNKFEEIIKTVKNDYDIVLVDTPPVGLVSDALIISQCADAAVYVILQDTVRVTRIRAGYDSLQSSNVKILGCVLNGALSGITGYGDNYGYSYSYFRYYGKYGYGKYGYGKYGYGYGYGSKTDEKESDDVSNRSHSKKSKKKSSRKSNNEKTSHTKTENSHSHHKGRKQKKESRKVNDDTQGVSINDITK